jgi:TadE-like protein
VFKTSRGANHLRSLFRRERRAGAPGPRGQSLVEFALVLPLLLVFLLGVADFGRVFTASITIEAAARNGAEAAAQEYLQLSKKSGGALAPADYVALHQVALDAVCAESEPLPNKVIAGGNCTMPLTAVCIHDDVDPGCGSEANPSVTDCTGVNSGWDHTNNGPALGSPAVALPYVEVRVCYLFTTLLNLGKLDLPFGWSLSLGDIWVQRDREFTVANY